MEQLHLKIFCNVNAKMPLETMKCAKHSSNDLLKKLTLCRHFSSGLEEREEILINMFPNWGNVQGGYAMYGQVDPNYQQQMLQWQQMNQMGGQQWGSYQQPAPPPLPVGGEAKPPEPPADEKPPLPPEPPPEGGDGKVTI